MYLLVDRNMTNNLGQKSRPTVWTKQNNGYHLLRTKKDLINPMANIPWRCPPRKWGEEEQEKWHIRQHHRPAKKVWKGAYASSLQVQIEKPRSQGLSQDQTARPCCLTSLICGFLIRKKSRRTLYILAASLRQCT